MKTALPLFIWLAVMLVGTSLPGSPDETPFPIPHFDKILHFFGYAVLGFLSFRFVASRWKVNRLKSMLLTLGAAAVYALLDELHQIPIPYRDASVWDFGADLSGFCCAFFSMVIIRKENRPV